MQTSGRLTRDRTVIIWKNFKKVATIEAHEQAVWAVRFIGEDRILTGSWSSPDPYLANMPQASADKKIILHSFDISSGRSTILQEYSGHTEPVRGLSLKKGGKGFWSCGNDGLVLASTIVCILWATPFSYLAFSRAGNNRLVSSGPEVI